MDKPSLKALRELHEKATPGPWEYFDRYFGRGAVWNGEDPVTDTSLEHPGMDTACVLKRDGELIAAARNALPALLAIAEAAIADRKAQEAVRMAYRHDMDSEEEQAAFEQGHDADKALAAALALVEE